MSSCTIEVHLKPRAAKNRIFTGEGGTIEVSVTSPPVDNKANDHLVRFLAEILGVSRSCLRIIKGGHSRSKAVSIDGLTKEEVMERLGRGN
jgi:uncharacterized protein (TIGR00251 family)